MGRKSTGCTVSQNFTPGYPSPGKRRKRTEETAQDVIHDPRTRVAVSETPSPNSSRSVKPVSLIQEGTNLESLLVDPTSTATVKTGTYTGQTFCAKTIYEKQQHSKQGGTTLLHVNKESTQSINFNLCSQTKNKHFDLKKTNSGLSLSCPQSPLQTYQRKQFPISNAQSPHTSSSKSAIKPKRRPVAVKESSGISIPKQDDNSASERLADLVRMVMGNTSNSGKTETTSTPATPHKEYYNRTNSGRQTWSTPDSAVENETPDHSYLLNSDSHFTPSALFQPNSPLTTLSGLDDLGIIFPETERAHYPKSDAYTDLLQGFSFSSSDLVQNVDQFGSESQAVILPNPQIIQTGLERTLDMASFTPIQDDSTTRPSVAARKNSKPSRRNVSEKTASTTDSAAELTPSALKRSARKPFATSSTNLKPDSVECTSSKDILSQVQLQSTGPGVFTEILKQWEEYMYSSPELMHQWECDNGRQFNYNDEAQCVLEDRQLAVWSIIDSLCPMPQIHLV